AFETVEGWVSGFLLGDVFSGGFTESGGGFFHIENIVGDLKEKSEGFAETAEARNIFCRSSGAQRARRDGGPNESGVFRAVNVFEHFRLDALAFRFEVGDLAADHAVNGSRGAGNFRKHGDATSGIDGGGGNRFECQSEESIAGENRRGFAEFLVASRLAAAEVIVVESGEIVVNQRVGVDKLDGTSRIVRG